MLIIDCCVRGEASATRRYARAYRKAHPESGEPEVLDLTKLNLTSLTAEELERRSALTAEGAFDDEMFALARQFRDAEEILIAAPYWDLSFPSLLKVYLERVCAAGVTFGYTEDGRCEGYCRAKRLLYFSTCGGFVGERHLGFEYVRAVAGMLGIENAEAFTLEGLDVDPARREEILRAAEEDMTIRL